MPKMFHSLGLDGPHQLAKIGALDPIAGLQNPQANCCFVPLIASGEHLISRSDAPACIKRIPIAHLIALPCGVGLLDGRRVEVGNYSSFRVLVEPGGTEASVCKRWELEADGILPQSHGSSDEGEAQIGDSLWYRFRSRDSRFTHVVVACSTLFFAYYSPTSQLAIMHLRGEFPALLDQLGRSRASRRDKATDTCFLELDRSRHSSEIHVIARSLFDETTFARQAAESIGVQCSLQTRRGRPIHFFAVPPFQCATQLRVKGCTQIVPSTSERVLIILQIMGCNAAFPWRRLEVVLDQPGESSGNEPGTSKPRGVRKVANEFDFDFVEIDGTGPRPGTELTPITFNVGSALRYDALSHKNLDIKRREVNRSDKSRIEKTGKDARNSSQRGNSKGDVDSRQTEFSVGGNAADEQEGKRGVKSKRMTPVEAIRHTTKELRKASSDPAISVNPLLLSPSGLQYGPWQLNCVDQTEGRPERWTKILNGSRPRGILIADIVSGGRHVYVFEIIRRLDESYSTLVICRPDCSAVPKSDLMSVLERIDQAQRLPKDEVLKQGLSLNIRRVTHYISYSGPHSLSGVLGTVLTGEHSSECQPNRTPACEES